MSDAYNTIREMAKLTIHSGKINDIQMKNLMMYPKIYFDGVTGGKIDYDLSSKPEWKVDKADIEQISFVSEKSDISFFVNYHLTVDPNVKNDNLINRLQAITEAVRGLFWNQVEVNVFINGSEIKKEG